MDGNPGNAKNSKIERKTLIFRDLMKKRSDILVKSFFFLDGITILDNQEKSGSE